LVISSGTRASSGILALEDNNPLFLIETFIILSRIYDVSIREELVRVTFVTAVITD
jgi:hypothetical protein